MATQSSGTKRMISLCFLLALVILLMQKAANPRVISDAFDALGVPLESPVELREPAALPEPGTNGYVAVAADRQDVAEDKSESTSIWNDTCQDLCRRLLIDVNQEELEEILSRSFAVFHSAGPEKTLPDANVELKEFAQRSQRRLLDLQQSFATAESSSATKLWIESFDQFEREWNEWLEILQGNDSESQPSAEFMAAIVAQLDLLKYRQLKNGSPWRPSEGVAFKRLLQMTRRDLIRSPGLKPLLENREPLSVSTVQLEAEFDQYQNQLISFRGSVRRIEWVSKAAEDFGIEDGYWLLWLRGADNSNQPVAVYSASKACQQLDDAVKDGEQPKIEVLGFVGKRLAYAAESGVEVTPTLFANSIIRFLEKIEPSNQLGVASPDRFRDLSWTLLTGAAVAGLVLVPIIWSWRRKSSRRQVPSRKLSRKGTSENEAINRASRLNSLLFFCFMMGADSAVAQSTPPWASQDSAATQVRNLLRTRIESLFNKEVIDGLADARALAAGDKDSRVPTPVLQLFDSARKIGWNKTLAAAEAGIVSRSALVQTVNVKGRVVAVQKVALSEAQEIWFRTGQTDKLFCLSIDTGGDQELLAYVSNVPSLWLSGEVKQPVEVRGLSLQKLDLAPGISDEDSKTQDRLLAIVAPQVAWLLSKDEKLDDLLPEIPKHWIALGNSGWDLAWLDAVVANNKKPIASAESAALLSLLKAAPEVTTKETVEERLTPIEAMRSSTRSLGKPLSWRVRAVEGAVVRLTDSDDRELLGEDLYYQVNGFVDLEGSNIKFQLNNSDETVVFEKEFPITILFAKDRIEVPAAVKNGGDATWEIGQYLQVEGVFYRLWSFDSELIRQKSATSRQAAPLVIGTAATLTRPPIRRTGGQPIGWFSYALCAAILVILGSILWIVSRKEERRRIHRKNV